MSILDLIRRPSFDDFDEPHPDDAWLDKAFDADEQLLGVHGLVGTSTRVPFGQILPWATFHSGWDKRGAPVMAPVGFLIHWTASRPTWARPAPALGICINGRADLPGPLSQLHLDRRARTTVIASGRANHAGRGDPHALAQIRAGTLAPLPKGRRIVSTGSSGGGLIGIEVENSGKPSEPFTPAQIAEIERIDKALRTHYAWLSRVHTLDHARWASDRKIDCITERAAVPCLRWLA